MLLFTIGLFNALFYRCCTSIIVASCRKAYRTVQNQTKSGMTFDKTRTPTPITPPPQLLDPTISLSLSCYMVWYQSMTDMTDT